VIEVGIVNINSYGGIGLANLIEAHPHIKLAAVAGHSSAGKTMRQIFPFWDGPDLPVLESLPPLDLVFSALPHVAAAETLAPLVRAGTRVVDLSADFRLRDAETYAEWYGHEHPAPDLLPGAVYGLTETARLQIYPAMLVANPGCYPTAAGLGLAPLLSAGLVDADAGVIVDAKSGVSGAGRTLKTESLFSEVDESVAAYALKGHRHLPEIEQIAATLLRDGAAPPITFVPHLIPMTRGILATIYVKPTERLSATALLGLYQDYYATSPCVRVAETSPATKWTIHTNLCVIHPTFDKRTGRLVIVSCIDNLVKGAAGQAVQNANLMLGLPEETGLPMRGNWP
jgi:N-acetyl-gamma-glutamyl-phosphate reductase